MIACLYCRLDSIYKKISGCDVWDEARDARLFRGSDVVIAHPPCRMWGRLRVFASATRKTVKTVEKNPGRAG
jgi:hypothetical protein